MSRLPLLIAAVLALKPAATATTVEPVHYHGYFEDADLVLVLYCTGIKKTDETEPKDGLSVQGMSADFEIRAIFKGTTDATTWTIKYKAIRVTDEELMVEKRQSQLHTLHELLKSQPRFERRKTYLAFIGPKPRQFTVELPTFAGPQ